MNQVFKKENINVYFLLTRNGLDGLVLNGGVVLQVQHVQHDGKKTVIQQCLLTHRVVLNQNTNQLEAVPAELTLTVCHQLVEYGEATNL